MFKMKKSILLISALIIMVVTSAVTYFTLSTVGIIDAGKVELTIKLNDNEKMYDGVELTGASYEITKGNIADGHKLEVTYTSTLKNVGKTQLNASARVVNEENVDVTKEYDISVVTAMLTVTPRPITVKVKDVEKIYDGSPITATDMEIVEGTLANGDAAMPSIDVISEDDAAKSYTVDATAAIYSFNGEDVTQNYVITTETAQLVINRAPITIKTNSQTLDFGPDLELEYGYEITSGSLMNNDIIANVQFVDLEKRAGIQTVEFKDSEDWITIKNYDGEIVEDVTSNYIIVKQNVGILTINAYELEITGIDDTLTYNATEQTSKLFEILEKTDKTFMEESNYKIEVVDSVKLKDVGTKPNILTFKITDLKENDITHNFKINFSVASLTIAPLDIEIVGEDKTFTFDYSNPDQVFEFSEYKQLDSSVSDFLKENEFKLNVKSKKSLKEAGEIENVLDIKVLYQDSVDVTKNFNITHVPGKLIVNPCEVVISYEESKEFKYDGTEKGIKISLKANNKLLEESDYQAEIDYINNDTGVTLSKKPIDAGTYTVKVRNIFFGKEIDEDNFKINYNSSGSFKITKKEISKDQISFDNKEFNYDGNVKHPNLKLIPLMPGDTYDVEYEIIDNVSGEEVDAIEVGTYTVVAYLSGDDLNNYKLGDTGSLEASVEFKIKSRQITTTSLLTNNKLSISFANIGDEITEDDLFTTSNLVENHKLVLKENIEIALKDITNAGTVNYECIVVDGSGNDVSENYSFTKNGSFTLSVSKQSVSFNAGYIKKTYDGMPIEIAVVSNQLSGVAELQNEAYAVSTLFDMNITGELPAGCIPVYMIDSSEDIIDVGEMSIFGGITDAYSSEIEFRVYIYYFDSETLQYSNVTNLFNISKTNGYQEVLPKEMTITVGSYTKEYDGEDFDEDLINPSISGAVINSSIGINDVETVLDYITYSIDDTMNAGTHTINVSMDSINHLYNYDIEVIGGTLEITKRNLIIDLGNYTKEYDGEAFTDALVTQIGAAEIDEIDIEYAIQAYSIDEDTDAGTHKISLTYANPNYNISIINGTLEITKRNLIIDLGNYTKEYDGYEFDEYDVEIKVQGEADADDIESGISYIMPSQTNVGTYYITATYTNSNYNVSIINGKVEITKRNLIIDLGNYTKEYDGYAFDSSDVEIKVQGEADTDDIASSISYVTPSQTNVGTYEITTTYTNSNYNVSIINGKVEITKRNLIIDLGNYTKEYDGYEFDSSDVEIKVLGEADTDDIASSISYVTPTQTNVGTYYITATYTNSNYNVSIINGKVEIAMKIVVVATGNYEKTYDGNAFKATDINISISDSSEIDASEFEVLLINDQLDELVEAVDTGIYNIAINYIGINENYKFIFVGGILTIE